MSLKGAKNNSNNFGKGVMQIDCFGQKEKHIRKTVGAV